ncbi:MAG: tRNA (adenosine(37)-N6)-threonylcarbamoyltransferase complex dimerization subunit type 1 TsaB [Clostridiales bacterium]|nr:tRNA (adenosine(37)-N6)-threonylcarbamoyltransferase complex dimerization subunit type 1 TsaB [Clostridiales bacterium]
MNILAIESSAKAASVALCRDEFLVAESYQNSGLTHSSTLMPMCEALLRNCGTALEDVDLIAVANGPGSFTGLRIGIATAKGLAWPGELPCAGVSTLEAMAWNLCGLAEGVVCCAMDARRNQVYNALFQLTENGPVRLTEDRAISLEQLFGDEEARKKIRFVVGDGAQMCYDYGKELGLDLRLVPPNLRYQHAYGVARCALERARAGKTVSGGALGANYLRLSQAERERLAKESAQKREAQDHTAEREK